MLKRLLILAAAIAAPCLPMTASAQAPAARRATFAELTPPPAPDYAKPDTWAALPGRKDAADIVPAAATPGDRQASAAVDVFYIYPTTELEKATWNTPYDSARVNAWTDLSVLSRQGGAFNAAGRVYAPRYRQAGSGASFPNEPSGPPAFALAYSDVRRAFEYYLAHYNKGRPFILVGHSQGGFHVARLVEEMIDGKPLQKRMVAAYALGVGMPIGVIEKRYKTVRLCDKPTQTGCLISWNSFLGGHDAEPMRKASAAAGAKGYGTISDATSACINPLTFDTAKPAAPAKANLGALVGDPTPGGQSDLTLAVGATGAECVRGMLIVDAGAADALKIKPLPGGSLHFQDMSLFYENIRLNAVARAQAFLKAR